MAMSSSSFPLLINEAVSAVAINEFGSVQVYFPLLFTIKSTNRVREKTASVGGLATFQEYDSAGGVNVLANDALQEQYSKEFLLGEYAKQVVLGRKFIDDQDWVLLSEIGSQIGIAAANTMEAHGVSIFNNADSAASNVYKIDDGLSLVNTAHTTRSNGTTQSNKGTAAFSTSALSAARLVMQGFTNSEGFKIPMVPDTILLPPALEDDGYEIIKSSGKVDSDENNVNIHYGRYKMIVWAQLSSTTSWFLLDSAKMARSLFFYIRIPLEISTSSNNGLSEVLSAYMRYSYGAKNWQWVYGSIVA